MKLGDPRFITGGVGLVAVTLALLVPVVRGADRTIRDLADAHRPETADTVAQVVNRLGSGGLLASAAALIAIYLVLRRRSPRPLILVAAAFLATGFAILPLKWILNRAAPHAGEPDLFSGGISYPSGHAVNSIVWYGVIAALLGIGSTWWRWIPPIAVTIAGTYLGYHWLTDMLAGLALGLLLDRALTKITVVRATPIIPAHRPDAAHADLAQ